MKDRHLRKQLDRIVRQLQHPNLCPDEATSACAIHLAREGTLAWASTHLKMRVGLYLNSRLLDIFRSVSCILTSARVRET